MKLQEELTVKSYNPSAYRYFTIHDPKERLIAVAPFRDRVVHHALINILEPVFERWFLKADIKEYFASIDHEIMLKLINRSIKDRNVIWLADKIISNGGTAGKGLPIGNLTSQFLANVYLDPLDHFIKDKEGVRHYLRYMDDFVLFSEDKCYIKDLRKKIEAFLSERLFLKLKSRATFINQRLNGLSFLGVRIFPRVIRIKPDNCRRLFKKMEAREKQYLACKISERGYMQSMMSMAGYLDSYNTLALRKKHFFGRMS